MQREELLEQKVTHHFSTLAMIQCPIFRHDKAKWHHTLHHQLANTKAISFFAYLIIFIGSLYIPEAIKQAVRLQII